LIQNQKKYAARQKKKSPDGDTRHPVDEHFFSIFSYVKKKVLDMT
jgi:hypothetical protein